MITKGMLTKVLIVLANAILVCSQSVLAETNIDRQTTTGRVDSLVIAVEGLLGKKGQDTDPMEAIRVTRALLYRVRAVEANDSLGPNPAHPLLEFGKQSSPESRWASVINILGTNLYSQIENRYMESLKTSTNTLEKIAAFQVLSKGLASSNAVGIIARELSVILRKIEDENITNQPHIRTELFWAAESLCYLGQTNGLEVMSWALDSDKTSSSEKVVAIEALETLHIKDARETLLLSAENLALSTNSSVARDTFDALSRVPEFQEIGTRAGVMQLERLKELCKTQSLGKDEWMLMTRVRSHFLGAQENGLLSSDDREKVKRIAAEIIRIGREKEGATVAVLINRMASDEDVSVIKELLISKWSKVRRQGIWSVLNCSPEVRMKIVGDVMPLLDDPDSQNRRVALDVIRVVKGEKPKDVDHWEVRSEDEFKTEANRVKAWWNLDKR